MWNKDNSSSHGSEDYDLDITKTIPYYESFHNESLKLIRTILNEILDVGQELLFKKL